MHKKQKPNAGKTHVSPPNTTTNVINRTYTQEEFEDTKGVATVLLVEETGVPGEYHRPVTSH